MSENRFELAALTYAARGWAVFPCKPESKEPATPNGFKDATTNPDQIRRWWARSPRANPAIATGSASGVWAIDPDNHDGKNGLATLAALERQHGALPRTPAQRTGSGGEHRLFRMNGIDVRNSAGKLGSGIDVRGNGGYIVLPPSVHPDGGVYAWIKSCHPAHIEPADAPDWLYQLLSEKKAGAGSSNSSSSSQDSYVRAAVERELGHLLSATVGDRNDTLNKAAFALGQFVGGGYLDRADAERRLLAAARAISLDEGEAVRTIASGLNAGEQQPREQTWTSDRPAEPFVARPKTDNTGHAPGDGGAKEDTGPGDQESATEDEDFSAYDRAQQSRLVTATPFTWTDPAMLPRRQWLYGRHLIRRFLSSTIAPGGYGKSSLIVTEALAMVTGQALLVDEPAGRLRVWQINLEDPEDELQRRFAAAAIHYELGAEDIGDRLFLNSGRKVNIVIVSESRDGIIIAVPIIEAIKAEIIDKAIDVLQIDPFVACHSVSENDNTKIAAVARQWADIAEATGCAIELVHHARKGGAGQGFTVDDARGASALIAAVRAARVLNGMTKEEAEKADIDNPASYFNIADGKANLAPRGDKASWRHIVGVPLGNGDDPFDPKGDLVGVVEPWSWPDPFAEVSVDDAKEVQRRIAQGEWRENSQSATWAGSVVADALGLDMSDKAAKATIRSLIAGWLASGALRVVSRKDNKRMKRNFIEVGQWIT